MSEKDKQKKAFKVKMFNDQSNQYEGMLGSYCLFTHSYELST